jgi:hypothetical protein
VTITCGSDVTGFDAVRVGRGMPRAPVPFCGCGGTPHGRGSFAERTVSGGRLSGRGKGVAKQTGVATRGLYLHYVQKRGCWYLVAPEPFGDGVRDLEEGSGRVSEERAARTYCLSGRTWPLLALSVPVGGRRVKGSGMAGVPSQREGPGQEKRRKREGRGSLAMGGNGPGRKGRKQESRGSLAMGGNGPGRGEKAGKPGFPRNGRERARKRGESGKAGVPSQWEGTGQEERRKRESRGSLAMGGNGPGRKEKAGKPGFPRNGRERAGEKGESGVGVGAGARLEAERGSGSE